MSSVVLPRVRIDQNSGAEGGKGRADRPPLKLTWTDRARNVSGGVTRGKAVGSRTRASVLLYLVPEFRGERRRSRGRHAMRIGVDCYPLQDESSRHRGIGRLAAELLHAMIGVDSSNQYVLYRCADRPDCPLPDGPRVLPRSYQAPQDAEAVATALQRAVVGNPDRLDLLLFFSPTQTRVEGVCEVPALAAVVYDLIPERHPEIYLDGGRHRAAHDRYVEAIRDYDLLFAISDYTRREFIEGRGFPPERMVTLPPAVDHGRFRPAPMTATFPADLAALGVVPPFVLHVGGTDPRKGAAELIEAFGLLPAPLRDGHQLVFAYCADRVAQIRDCAGWRHGTGSACS